MENQTITTSNRMHPLLMGAAASVIGVSLLGMAAITGVLPSSHGSAPPLATAYPAGALLTAKAPIQSADPVVATRYVTPEGQVLEVVPSKSQVKPVHQARVVHHDTVNGQPPVVHHKVAHHYTQPAFHQQQQQYSQNTYSEPARTYQQSRPAAQQHPIQNYVNDMHPVGTGIGAVVGGLLGNQVGGGNGKKLATVAGALLGGYAGNEVAHDRSPLPW